MDASSVALIEALFTRISNHFSLDEGAVRRSCEDLLTAAGLPESVRAPVARRRKGSGGSLAGESARHAKPAAAPAATRVARPAAAETSHASGGRALLTKSRSASSLSAAAPVKTTLAKAHPSRQQGAKPVPLTAGALKALQERTSPPLHPRGSHFLKLSCPPRPELKAQAHPHLYGPTVTALPALKGSNRDEEAPLVPRLYL